MALLAKLKINSTDYSLYECEYSFTQATDITGRPSDRPRGGVIHLTIMSLSDRDLFFHRWMRDRDTLHDGEIVFPINYNGGVAEKKLRFKDAYCVGLHEHYVKGEVDAMSMKLTIAAGSITFGDNCEFKLID